MFHSSPLRWCFAGKDFTESVHRCGPWNWRRFKCSNPLVDTSFTTRRHQMSPNLFAFLRWDESDFHSISWFLVLFPVASLQTHNSCEFMMLWLSNLPNIKHLHIRNDPPPSEPWLSVASGNTGAKKRKVQGRIGARNGSVDPGGCLVVYLY